MGLDAGADGFAGISLGERGGWSWGVLDLGSRLLLCPCAPLGRRRAFGGPVAGLGRGLQGIAWASPFIFVSLSCCVGA